MNQDELREKFNRILSLGLVAKAISPRVNIGAEMLSKFKKGHVNLSNSACIRLNNYLDRVVIPEY